MNKEGFNELGKFLDNEDHDAKGIVKFFKGMVNMGKVHSYHYTGLNITFNTKSEMENAEKQIKSYYTG